MDILLNIDHSIAGEIISYLCDMTFLDDQEALFKNFRNNPDMLLYNANKQGEGITKKEILKYSAKYMFDVFLCICQEYYVGDKGTNSEKKMVLALCKKLQK